MLKAIRIVVNDYMSNFPPPAGLKRYKKGTAPASYSSRDWYHCTRWVEKGDDIREIKTRRSFGRAFNLTLARLVEPQEQRVIQEGDKHTTVINKSKTKVFDILYWAAFDNRLEHHIFNDPLTGEDDPTLGGLQTFLDSST